MSVYQALATFKADGVPFSRCQMIAVDASKAYTQQNFAALIERVERLRAVQREVCGRQSTYSLPSSTTPLPVDRVPKVAVIDTRCQCA